MCIEAFEIGNEYESFFFTKTFGKPAAEIAKITNATIADFNEQKGISTEVNNPDTLVQIWLDPNPVGGSTAMSTDDLEARNPAGLAFHQTERQRENHFEQG